MHREWIRQHRYRRVGLENGLTVLVNENRRLPLLSLNAFVLAGSSQNPGPRPGLAALTARLLDEGTRSYSAHDIGRLVENAGGTLSAFAERELSGVSLYLQAPDCPMALDLLREILLYPTFPEARFALERDKAISRLRAMKDDPQVVAFHRFNRWIYGGSPLENPILGTPQSMRSVQVSEVLEFHRRKYGPRNTYIVAVGDVDAVQLEDAVRRRFEEWDNPEFELDPSPRLSRQREPIHDCHHMDREQVTICLGHLGVTRDNPDFHALQVMDTIMGSGPGLTGRIPRKLRDEQGLAYHAYCDIASSSGTLPGRFVACIATSPRNRERALAGLVGEIRQLAGQGVTEEELATAQDYLTGSFVFEFQSITSIARYLLGSELFQLGADYLDRYPSLIRSVTGQEVQRVARKYLDTINYTTVVVGPLHHGGEAAASRHF